MKNIVLVISFLMMGLVSQEEAKAESIYRASIVVGGRLFQDLFVINGLPENEFTDAKLTGSVTVPGNFSVPMTGIYQRPQLWSDIPAKVTLNIEAIERGNKFKVHYEMNVSYGLNEIEGSAFLENGEKLGDFKGVRILKE